MPARCYDADAMPTPRLPRPIARHPAFVLLMTITGCTVGHVPPPAGPPPPSQPSVGGHPDMTGWRLMADAWVARSFEREIIRVGKYEGRVARIMLVVTNSSLEVGDVVIQFGNAQRWSPGLRHSFADGSRSRAIDLPGHVRSIRGVELVRGGVPPGTRTRVELWGQ
jgi:hypothetical protein